MEETFTLSTRSELSQLKNVRQKVEAFLSAWAVDEEKVFQLLLIMDEVLTNIMKYGYGDREGEIRIRVTCRDQTVEMVIEDDAPPFDPLTYPPVDMEKHLREGHTHGLGIHVLRLYADECAYQPLSHGNRLVIRKTVR